MGVNGINGFNNYELYKNQQVNFGQGGTQGVNPFEPQREFRGPEPVKRNEDNLDPNMLAQKKESFEVGLGGTNNPDDHKIFYAA